MITKVKRTIPLLALLSAAMLTPLVYAADGNINITGRVSESACNIATSSKDMTIEMGRLIGRCSVLSVMEVLKRYSIWKLNVGLLRS